MLKTGAVPAVPDCPGDSAQRTLRCPHRGVPDRVPRGQRGGAGPGQGENLKLTGTAPVLRDYQNEAVTAVVASWGSGLKRPAILMSTGLGKTVVFAELSRLMAASAGRRPLVLVHRDELVRQSVAKLRDADPNLRIGIIQGSNMGIARTDIVVASVQTLSRTNRLSQISPERFDLIICDEAHHASANSYRAILEHFGAFDSNSRTLCLGVTATMARGDGQGLGEIWQEVVFERGIRYGVEEGHLVPAEVRTVRLAGLDTDRVRAGIDGDLAAGALAKAMTTAHAGPIIAKAYADFGRHSDGRFRRAAVFAPTVEVALAWQADFLEMGARTAVITGKTPTDERQVAYARLAAGSLDALLSVMVLSEGWDCPAVEVAIVARPTKSMPLLTQIVGRVLRPSPGTGKAAALVIDVVGAMGHGLARTFDLSIPEPVVRISPLQSDFDELIEGGEPAQALAIPAVDWVALDLHGAPLARVKRRRGHDGPEWLRTYDGVPFLSPTLDFPDLLFVATRTDPDGTVRGPWWIKRKGVAAEPLELSPGADLRDIHPGVKPIRLWLDPTDRQIALLERLIHPVTGMRLLDTAGPSLSSARASDLLAVHFASRELRKAFSTSPIAPLMTAVSA